MRAEEEIFYLLILSLKRIYALSDLSPKPWKKENQRDLFILNRWRIRDFLRESYVLDLVLVNRMSLIRWPTMSVAQECMKDASCQFILCWFGGGWLYHRRNLKIYIWSGVPAHNREQRLRNGLCQFLWSAFCSESGIKDPIPATWR